MICCVSLSYIKVNVIFWGLELLIRQNKAFDDVPLDSKNLFFSNAWWTKWLIDKSKQCKKNIC